MFSDVDKKIIRELQGDLPLEPRPYAIIAERLGLNEAEVIEKLADFLKKGVVRRIGAALRHRSIGIKANGMSVWIVPKDRVEDVGRIMAAYKEITHCYERPAQPGWPYNLFAMVHGKTKEECEAVAREISVRTGISDYKLLYSTRELKKTSMVYFSD